MNKLVINSEKTIAMSFHWQNIGYFMPHFVFEDMGIIYTGTTRFLGIYLTEHIKWNVHIEHFE
jgi:hypothetical protein